MKELKIDPELRDLLPPLTDEEYKQLKKNIIENGFDENFPIMTWKGYIVDGHNRYKICKEHNIDFVYGTLAYKTKEEVMEWMLDIQLGRRNLSPIQRIAIAEKYRSLYEKQAKEQQIKAGKEYGNGGIKVTPKLVEASKGNRSDNETNTRLSQVAGVGKETYRMGAKILNSDNEKVKNAVLSGEMSINAGYQKIRKNETRTCTMCGKEKKVIDFFGNDIICKECSRKESEKNINEQKSSSSKPSLEMIDVYKDVLTAKNAKDQINQDYEIEWLKDKCDDFVSQVNDKFFNLLTAIEKMDEEHISKAYIILEDFISDVFEIQYKFNNKKEN